MLGTKNGEIEPNRKQTRYKYSPAHQDVAVCCNPNAGRISPYFVQNSWMKKYRDWETDRKSTRLNSSHSAKSRMPSSA